LCRNLQHQCPNTPATVVVGSEINIALMTKEGAEIGEAERIGILVQIAIAVGADLEAVIGQAIGTVTVPVPTGAHIAKEKDHMSETITKALAMIDQGMNMGTNMSGIAPVIGIQTSMIETEIETEIEIAGIPLRGGRTIDTTEKGPRIRT
jgi:hypothetical protein